MSEPQEYVKYNAVFISKEDERFDARFLARFGEHQKSVRLADHGPILWKDGAPFDAKSGAPAIILHIGKIRWLSWRRVDVPAEYNCSVLCGYGALFHLHRRGLKTWTVDGVSGGCISIMFATDSPELSSRSVVQRGNSALANSASRNTVLR